MSPDPILAEYMRGAPNGGVFAASNLWLYSYTANNPVRYIDPSGQFKITWEGVKILGREALRRAAPAAVGAARAAGAAGAAVTSLTIYWDQVQKLGKEVYEQENANLDAKARAEARERAEAPAPPTQAGGGSAKEPPAGPPAPPEAAEEPKEGAGRGGRKLEPDPSAQGEHSTFRRDPVTGRVSGHAQWKPNPRNPRGFDQVQRTDITGAPHYNKVTGERVPTPHTQGKDIPGGVRPSTPEEIPK